MAPAASPVVPWTETPLTWSRSLSKVTGCNIYLKLENLQPSGSFKSRGIGNYMQCNLTDGPNHFFCSSGGNAGLACVHAAVTLGHPATIVVPLSTSEYMIQKLRDAGAAEVIQVGTSWYEADQHLNQEILPKAKAEGINAVYVHPFDQPDIWEGHATMIPEMVEQLSKVRKHYPVELSGSPSEVGADAIICSAGGGGLFCGIMRGLRQANLETTKVVVVETVGADSLNQSVQKSQLVTLPAITSIATTLGARTVAKQAFLEATSGSNVKSVVLSDAEAIEGCKRFLEDERILVEPSCGVSLAACYSGKLKEFLPDLTPESNVVIIVCGGSGISAEILEKYVKQYLP